MRPLLVVWAALLGLLTWIVGAVLVDLLGVPGDSPVSYAIRLVLLGLGLFWVIRVAGRRR